MNAEYKIEYDDASIDSIDHRIIFGIPSSDLIEETNNMGEGDENGEEFILPTNEIVTAEDLFSMAHNDFLMAQNSIEHHVDTSDYNQQEYFDYQITEEVITDDWVHPGEDRIEVSVNELVDDAQYEGVTVPFPADEYTTLHPFPCDFCSRRFRNEANLMKHLVAHKSGRQNVCHLCGDHCTCDCDLTSHLKVHAQMPVPGCKQDDESFLDVKDTSSLENRKRFADSTVCVPQLKKQFKRSYVTRKKQSKNTKRISLQNDEDESVLPDNSASADKVRPHVCQQCEARFDCEKTLKAHVTSHAVTNAFECERCDEVFWSFDSLEKHMKMHEDQSEDNGAYHCCTFCGVVFPDKLDLIAHAETHKLAARQKCSLCGEIVMSEILKDHILMLHASELTENTCQWCGKDCKNGGNLRKHLKIHSTAKNYCCSTCGKNFKTKSSLKRHIQSHRNKSVACDVCGEILPDGRSLRSHRHTHTNAWKQKFPCSECGKIFGSRSSHQIHMRIHTGERPYRCQYCWKAFADGGTLRKHERIHTGEKPYTCPVCPKAFNQRVTLRDHIRSHYSEAEPSGLTTSILCSLCGNLFKTPAEIIQHLIEHSDANTAAKRRTTVGPRNYMRRRKLKSNELKTVRTSTIDVNVNRSEMKLKRKSSQKRNARRRNDIEDYEHDMKSKLQETQLDERNYVSVDVQTSIPELDESSNSVWSSGDEDEISLLVSAKQNSTTILRAPSSKEQRERQTHTRCETFSADFRAAASRTSTETGGFTDALKTDTTLSTAFYEQLTKRNQSERIITPLKAPSSQRSVNLQPLPMTCMDTMMPIWSDDQELNAEPLSTNNNVQQEMRAPIPLNSTNRVFTCEMCAAAFSDRAQLLIHVRVHI